MIWVYAASTWFELGALDSRDPPCQLLLAAAGDGSSGVLIPHSRQPALDALREDSKSLVVNTGGLPPEIIAFSAEIFLRKAAETVRSGAGEVDLSPDALAEWGEIGGTA